MHFIYYLINSILDSHAPIKNIKIRSKPNPYVTDEIRSLMKMRDKWRKFARKTNDPLAWARYKNYKREVKHELRLAEREYVEQQIRNNPKNTSCIWKTIRACIPKRSVSCKSYIKDDKTVAKVSTNFLLQLDKIQLRKYGFSQGKVIMTLPGRLLSQGAIQNKNSFHLDQ